jgi:hypothetical protein
MEIKSFNISEDWTKFRELDEFAFYIASLIPIDFPWMLSSINKALEVWQGLKESSQANKHTFLQTKELRQGCHMQTCMQKKVFVGSNFCITNTRYLWCTKNGK